VKICSQVTILGKHLVCDEVRTGASSTKRRSMECQRKMKQTTKKVLQKRIKRSTGATAVALKQKHSIEYLNGVELQIMAL
jgi:hypothetical protein